MSKPENELDMWKRRAGFRTDVALAVALEVTPITLRNWRKKRLTRVVVLAMMELERQHKETRYVG